MCRGSRVWGKKEIREREHGEQEFPSGVLGSGDFGLGLDSVSHSALDSYAGAVPNTGPPMPLTILFPRLHHPAIEERYASWQTECSSARGAGSDGAEIRGRRAGRPSPRRRRGRAGDRGDRSPAVPSPATIPLLMSALDGESATAAALPVSNESANPHQRRNPPVPYLTLRQFEDAAAAVTGRPGCGSMSNGTNPIPACTSLRGRCCPRATNRWPERSRVRR